MKAWLVYCGKLLGNIFARDEEHALQMAAVYWGRGKAYKVKPHERQKVRPRPSS